MPKLKYPKELKLEVVYYVMNGHTMNEAEKKFCIGKANIQKWRDAYKLHGTDGLMVRQKDHNRYSSDFKAHVVEYKRDNQLSARQAAAYFNIPTWQTVLSWEKKYKEGGPGAFLAETRGKAGCRAGAMKGPEPRFSNEEMENLKAENERLKMENEYLKKLNALIQKREGSARKTKPLS